MAGRFCFHNSGSWTILAPEGWPPHPECPLSLSRLGLGILVNIQAAFGTWVPCTPEDQRRPDLLWVSQLPPNTSPWKAILLHAVGASCPECFCSFNLIPRLYSLHSIRTPLYLHTSGQHPPSFNHHFDQADLKESLLITFGKAPWNISAVFKGVRGSSRLASHVQLWQLIRKNCLLPLITCSVVSHHSHPTPTSLLNNM